MKRRLLRIGLGILGAVLLLVGAGWVLVRLLPTREPLYAGRPFKHWLDESRVAATRAQAEQVLTNTVVPALVATAEHDTDPAWRTWLVDRLNSLPGVEVTHLPADVRRGRALYWLSLVGHTDARIEPFLIGKLNDSNPPTRLIAAQGLCRMRVDAAIIVPTLVRWLAALAPEDEDDAMIIMPLLAGYGPAARAAAPHLVKLLASNGKGVAPSARYALERIDPEALKTADAEPGKKSP